ncbi:MAG: rhodanese-like domain-containing protein [Pseudomonadota bacterium]
MTASAALLHSAFYRFTPLADPLAAAAVLRPLAQGLHGSIVLAGEGINGVLAGAPADLAAFEAALQRADVLGGALQGMAFRHSACSRPPFGRLKISVKPEIVALALPDGAAAGPLPPPDEHDASHLDPLAWRALLARGDAVVLDNRNHFEFRLGHFRGATDPQVHNFRDFGAYVQAHAPAWRAAGRPVAMYCTGGIRCDKTAPRLRSLGLQVWQLGGGILHYLHALDDAAQDWQGDCYVFDKRIALDSQLRETGTSAAQVFDPAHPDEAWRLQRAQRLDGALG